MRFAKWAFAGSVGVLLMCVAAANAATYVTSTQGTVVVMRGNSVIRLSPGDVLKPGDRVLATNGSSASYSDGMTIGSNSSVLVHKDGLEVVSKTSGSSASKASNSNLYSSKYDKDDNGRDGDRRDQHDRNEKGDLGGDRDHPDKGAKDHDDDKGSSSYNDRDNDKPWHGKPQDSQSCTP